MSETDNTVWLPTNPPRPAPHLLTEEELIVFLRLDVLGVKKPKRTICHWRDRGWLKSVRISRAMVYRLEDAMELAARLSKNSEHPEIKPPTVAFGVKRARMKVKGTP